MNFIINKIKQFILNSFISSLLLICLITFNSYLNINILSSHINFIKIISVFTNNKLIDLNLVDEQSVSSFVLYDEVVYEKPHYILINYSSNGVYSLTDGIIISKTKNVNGTYSVTIQTYDDYYYIYENLETVDFDIYSLIKTETILGTSIFNSDVQGYEFTLKIIKNGMEISYENI